MTRTYDDYSTFSAGESMWFAADQDARARCDGFVLNGALRSDVLTVDGSQGLGRLGQPLGAIRPLRPLGTPRIFLPPRS